MCPRFLLYTEKQMATEYTNLYSILYTISLFFYQLGLILVSNTVEKCFYFKLNCKITEQ